MAALLMFSIMQSHNILDGNFSGIFHLHKSKMAAMWFEYYHIMPRNFGTHEERNMYNVSK